MLKSLIVAALLATGGRAQAGDVFDACQAASSWDLTITPNALVFDRVAPAPRKIELHGRRLRVDGSDARQDMENGDRLELFERDLRTLVPRIKTIAAHAVDIAMSGLRADAAALGLSAAARADLEQRLTAQARALKQAIASSTSTHDWQGATLDQRVDTVVADIAPVLAADLAAQALATALGGDLDGAAAMRDRAADLASELRPKLERRLQVLRPQVAALCPSIRTLHDLQRGLRDRDGRALDLLTISAP